MNNIFIDPAPIPGRDPAPIPGRGLFKLVKNIIKILSKDWKGGKI